MKRVLKSLVVEAGVAVDSAAVAVVVRAGNAIAGKLVLLSEHMKGCHAFMAPLYLPTFNQTTRQLP